MNKLILFLIVFPLLAFGQKKEVSDKAIENQFLTVVKDVEVEKMLDKTAEFNDCRKKNEFDPKDKKPERDKKLADATKCFEDKLAKNKDPKALQNLADSLRLENYGLIKSKNVSDITKYLSQKMHKSLTGVDYDDKNTKWGHQKIVDQKVFIDLYTNQLMKSALFEVSRFCFENLEIKSTTKKGTTFSSYWFPPNPVMILIQDPKYPNDSTRKIADITNLSDTGSTSFLNMADTADLTKKDDVLKEIQKAITSADTQPDLYKQFFPFCQSTITQLCDEFRKDTANTGTTAKNETTDTRNLAGMTRGANACLTMDKLQAIRTTLANTEKVAKQFDEMGEDKNKFALQMIESPNLYQRGKGKNEDSLDEITTFTSSDMLQEGGDDKISELQKCRSNATSDDCKAYLVEGDSLDKAINNVESEMNLKREIEIARVKEMEGKIDDLKKYLTDNGHFDLLEKLEKNNQLDIKTELGKIYDARKVAEIESLKLKVGKRQVSEADNKTDDDKKNMIEKNIIDSKEERARMAQVVMFNNIITSQLELEDKSGNKVGRNVTGINKEFAGMGKAYDPTLFSGIQADAKQSSSGLDDISISGGGIIDAILGKKSD
jgi:hypothetical protein